MTYYKAFYMGHPMPTTPSESAAGSWERVRNGLNKGQPSDVKFLKAAGYSVRKLKGELPEVLSSESTSKSSTAIPLDGQVRDQYPDVPEERTHTQWIYHADGWSEQVTTPEARRYEDFAVASVKVAALIWVACLLGVLIWGLWLHMGG